MKGRNTWRSHQWINRGHVHCLMTWVNALAAKKLCSIFTINIVMSGCRLYITQSQEIQSALYFWNAISLQHIVKMGTGPEIHIVQLFRWNTLFATHLHSTAHEWDNWIWLCVTSGLLRITIQCPVRITQNVRIMIVSHQMQLLQIKYHRKLCSVPYPLSISRGLVSMLSRRSTVLFPLSCEM